MLADLVRDRPLMAFFGGFGAEINLLFASRPLCSPALWLPLIQTDGHPELSLGKADGVNWRPGDARFVQQLPNHPVDNRNDLLANQFLAHGRLSSWENSLNVYLCILMIQPIQGNSAAE